MPKSLNFWPAPWTHISQSRDIKPPIEPTIYWSKHLCSRCLSGLRCRYVMSVRARNRESIKNHQNCQWMCFGFWFTRLNRQLLISCHNTDNQVKVWLLDSKWNASDILHHHLWKHFFNMQGHRLWFKNHVRTSFETLFCSCYLFCKRKRRKTKGISSKTFLNQQMWVLKQMLQATK